MNTLLLTIDFINDIVHTEGKIPSCAAYVEQHNIIQQTNKAIDYARKHHLPIAHVKVGFNKGYLECPKHSPVFGQAEKYGALQLGEWGTEFHDSLSVKNDDYVIIKHRISALYATDLETILRANNIDTVIIAGVSTNMAVSSTARELHDRDYRVMVLSDACGAADLDTHQHALASIERIATVCTTTDILIL